MLNKIIEWIKRQQVEDPKMYRMLKFLPILVVFVAFYISGYMIQVFRNAFHPENQTSLNPFVCLSYSVFSRAGWIFAGVLIVVGLFFLMAVNPKEDYRNPVAEVDEEGVARKENATFGRARKVGFEEAKEYYEVDSIENVDGMIFGQFDEEGTQVCAMKAKPTDNKNTTIIGAPGTGKSYTIIRNAILQCIKRNESFVVVDPKGELYEDLFLEVERRGYNVKLFNLVEQENSDPIDLLAECFDINGDLNTDRIDSFVKNILANTRDTDRPDTFWESGADNLLSLHVHLVLEKYMNYVNRRFLETMRDAIGIQNEKLDAAMIPNIYKSFLHWRFATLKAQVMRVVDDQRDEITGRSYGVEERQKTLAYIQKCTSEEEFYTHDGRMDAKKKIEDCFRDFECKDYILVLVQEYIRRICESDDRIWEFTRSNCQEWCKENNSGYASENRAAKRMLLREMLNYCKATPIERERIIDSIEAGQNTPRCTMGDVYYNIVHFSDIELGQAVRDLPESSTAKISYTTYLNKSTDTIRQSHQSGLINRLGIFKNKNIRRITCNKDIEFAKMGDERTAIFIKISDLDRSYSVITSLFFSFMIQDLSDAYDKSPNKEAKLPVALIMDEFKNCGVIPNIPTAITTIRGRKIYIVLALQNKGQLKANYGEDDGETILGACDYIVFLGSNDEETARYISTRCGVSTVQTSSKKEHDNGSLFASRFRDNDISTGEAVRNVYNIDEVYTLAPRRAIVIKRGRYSAEMNTIVWKKHPYANGGNLPKTLTCNHMKVIEKYPLYDVCLDSFLSSENSAKDYREKHGISLPNYDIWEIKKSLRKRIEGREVQQTVREYKAAGAEEVVIAQTEDLQETVTLLESPTTEEPVVREEEPELVLDLYDTTENLPEPEVNREIKQNNLLDPEREKKDAGDSKENTGGERTVATSMQKEAVDERKRDIEPQNKDSPEKVQEPQNKPKRPFRSHRRGTERVHKF